MLPPAPARLSTTTVCFQSSPRRCAISRATTSVEPPGENGTTSVTCFVGQAPPLWARGEAARQGEQRGDEDGAASARAGGRTGMSVSCWLGIVLEAFSAGCDGARHPVSASAYARPTASAKRERAGDPVLAQAAPRAELDEQQAHAAAEVEREQDDEAPLGELDERRVGEGEEACRARRRPSAPGRGRGNAAAGRSRGRGRRGDAARTRRMRRAGARARRRVAAQRRGRARGAAHASTTAAIARAPSTTSSSAKTRDSISDARPPRPHHSRAMLATPIGTCTAQASTKRP